MAVCLDKHVVYHAPHTVHTASLLLSVRVMLESGGGWDAEILARAGFSFIP